MRVPAQRLRFARSLALFALKIHFYHNLEFFGIMSMNFSIPGHKYITMVRILIITYQYFAALMDTGLTIVCFVSQ